MDLRRLDERALALGHGLRPLALHETTHIWQSNKKRENKTSTADGEMLELCASGGDKEEELSLSQS